MEGIIRKTTEQDKEYIEKEIGKKTIREQFIKKVNDEEQEATKKGLPFARKAAIEAYDNSIKEQKEQQIREFGYIKRIIPATNLEPYSDIKNFKLINKKRVRDTELSKIHKMPIFIETKTYQFKGYVEKYDVMEDPDIAIEKAYSKHEEDKGEKNADKKQ